MTPDTGPALDLVSAQEAVASLADDQAGALADELRQLALHMADRIHYAEGRRAGFVTIGGALVAFGTAALSLVSFAGDGKESLLLSKVAVAIGVTAVVSGLLIWFLYSRQTNFEYAFKPVAGPRSWFYRDAIPKSAGFRIPWIAYVLSKATGARSENDAIHKAYVEGWPDFASSQTSLLVDPHKRAVEHLGQVYLLHYNEYYKNKFLTQLRKVTATLLGILAVEILVFASVAAASLTARASP